MIDYAAIRRTVRFAREQGWIWVAADRHAYDALAAKYDTVCGERDFWRALYLKEFNGRTLQGKAALLLAIKTRLENGVEFNASTLANEFGVSSKTVHRWINHARDQSALSFRWNRSRNTFILDREEAKAA